MARVLLAAASTRSKQHTCSKKALPQLIDVPVSKRDLITYLVDLSTRPTFCSVELLAFFVKSEEHRERLRELLLPEFQVRTQQRHQRLYSRVAGRAHHSLPRASITNTSASRAEPFLRF